MFVYAIIFFAIIAVFFTMFSNDNPAEDTSLSTMLSMAENEEISRIVVDGDKLIITPRSAPDRLMVVSKATGTSLFEIFSAAGLNPTELSIQIEFDQSGSFGSEPVSYTHLTLPTKSSL